MATAAYVRVRSLFAGGMLRGRATVQTPEEIERNVASLWGLSSGATRLRPTEDAKQMIRKAHNLVVIRVPGIGAVFAPSRFVGYANNTLARHFRDLYMNGGITDSAITRALHAQRPRPRADLEATFRAFCLRPEVDVRPDDRERDYWPIWTVGRWWRSTRGPRNGAVSSDAEFGRVVLAYDRISERKTQAEQAMLRKHLLRGATKGRCSLCRREFPLELLVAAHIKPRSQCTRKEQSDSLLSKLN